jgi:hypothetical protein
MVVYKSSLELEGANSYLTKLVTAFTNAEHQGQYQLSARLAHRLAQQLAELGEQKTASQWLKRSIQLYKLQTNLPPDFWATLCDWLNLVVGKEGELSEVLETLQPAGQLSESCAENVLTDFYSIGISSQSHLTGQTSLARLELKFLGKLSCRFEDSFHALRPRFAELLTVLALHPRGLSNEQLTLAVYGETTDVNCCKTELSRLKQLLPIASRPYRLEMNIWADFLELPALLNAGRISEAIDLYEGPLLPSSEAPEVCSLRRSLEESLRAATLESGSSEDLWKLGSCVHDDLELWEAIQARLAQGDPRRGMARAHVSSLRRAWGL